jgi:hypothetical protein
MMIQLKSPLPIILPLLLLLLPLGSGAAETCTTDLACYNGSVDVNAQLVLLAPKSRKECIDQVKALKEKCATPSPFSVVFIDQSKKGMVSSYSSPNVIPEMMAAINILLQD